MTAQIERSGPVRLAQISAGMPADNGTFRKDRTKIVTMFEKELSQYWKTIIETMPDGLMVVDPEGVIVLVNSTLERLTGYTKGELVGQTCDMLGCDVCSKEMAEGADKHCALFKEENIRRARCTLRKKEGDPLYAVKNASVLRDGKGNVIGGVETLTDLSEVRDKEEIISDLRRELDDKDIRHGIIGASPAILQIFDLISSAAQSDAPVLIYGESGTGKELVADAIHKEGSRSKGPFIKVNCAALSESLLESELFGHVKGAFTGADRARTGRFEAADRGDIFLDEIAEIPNSVQVKFLRVLQEKEIERVGDHRPISVDARIISATNRDIEKLMEKGRFREDLYYRIGVILVDLPPLRERREDIPLLINAFVNRVRLRTGKPIFGMNTEALERLNAHKWPGNVRELINAIEHAFVLCPEGEIMPEHLPRQLAGRRQMFAAWKSAPQKIDAGERQRIMDALSAAGGNKSEASRRLGISRVSLYKRLRKYNIHQSELGTIVPTP